MKVMQNQLQPIKLFLVIFADLCMKCFRQKDIVALLCFTSCLFEVLHLFNIKFGISQECEPSFPRFNICNHELCSYDPLMARLTSLPLGIGLWF